jgi:hypothetical protein
MKRQHWSRNTCHLNRGKLEFPIESLLTGQWNKRDTTSNKSSWMCSAEHLQKCWSIPWQPVSNSLGRPHFDPWDIFPSKRWGEHTYFHQCFWLLYPRFIRTPLVPHGSKFTTQEGCNSCQFSRLNFMEFWCAKGANREAEIRGAKWWGGWVVWGGVVLDPQLDWSRETVLGSL